MSAYLAPWFVPQFFKNDGTVAAGCYLYTYVTGTTTDKDTYQDQAASTTHANPIVLDSAGRIQPAMFLDNDAEYRFRLETPDGALIDQWDDVGIEDFTPNGTYSPLLTNVANVDGSSANAEATWFRVGDVVSVSAVISINPTAANAITSVGISLPVASDFTNGGQLAGQAAREALAAGQISAYITADTTNNRAQLDYYNDATVLSSNWTVNFQYRVL